MSDNILIKSVKSWFHDGEEIFLKSLSEYDNQGNEILKELYFGPNEMETKTINKFNEKGFLLEEINYGEDNEITDSTLFERNEEGKLIQSTISFADGSKTFKKYLRENNDKTITISEESDEGEFESKEKAEFDEKGNIIHRISFDQDDHITEQHQFVYSENNDIIKEISFEGESKVSETHFLYDENNNLIKRITLNNEGETIEWALYKYDENGKNIEQQYGDYTLYKMEYNEKGLLIREQKVNSMGVVDYSKSYKYNESGILIEENDLNYKISFEYEYHT